jgi:hypothetical protein
MLINVYKIYTGPLSVQDQYSRLFPISSSFRYNGSVITWTVVCLTADKFKPLILCMSNQFQSRAEQSSSLLPATNQHGRSWHRAPLGPMTIYLFNVKTFYFLSSVVPPLIKWEGLDFFYNWCSLVPYLRFTAYCYNTDRIENTASNTFSIYYYYKAVNTTNSL